MIYELRTYTVKPGTLGDMVKAASTMSRDIRKDDYGKLEGYWSTEIGPLNQVLHMWSYNGFDERARLRGRTCQEPALDRRVRAADPAVAGASGRPPDERGGPPVAPASTGNVYELRNYRGKAAGGLKQWLDAFTAVLPEREKYSKIVGLWTTEAGQPNEACHIWAYPSLNARAEARGNAHEGSGLAGIPRQGPGLPRGDALDHHAAGAAFAVAVSCPCSPDERSDIRGGVRVSRMSLRSSGLQVTRPSDNNSRACRARSGAARGASPARRAAA